MARIIILLTGFTFLISVSAGTSPSPDAIKLRKLRINLEKNYKAHGLDGIHKDLKHAWTVAMKAVEKHSSSEMINLQNFLKKVQEDYNKKVARKIHNEVEDDWDRYMKVFGKEYTSEEKEMRKAIFNKNKERVQQHNDLFEQGKVSYRIQMNHFSDKTREELKKMRSSRPTNSTNRPIHHVQSKREAQKTIGFLHYYRYDISYKMRGSIDWRRKGCVTPVKHQGECASCYAFAGIGALEAYHKKETGNLINLSVQCIIDCTWDLFHDGNDGCDGGLPHLVFEYTQNNGVISEVHYPYTMNASHNCRWKKDDVVTTHEGYLRVRKGDELALRQAVGKHGPVATSLSTAKDFDLYERGVYHPQNCNSLDHAVLIVGYGTDPEQGDYWVCKNSFGKWWGVDGYVLIPRNKNNVCDVATSAEFPV